MEEAGKSELYAGLPSQVSMTAVQPARDTPTLLSFHTIVSNDIGPSGVHHTGKGKLTTSCFPIFRHENEMGFQGTKVNLPVVKRHSYAIGCAKARKVSPPRQQLCSFFDSVFNQIKLIVSQDDALSTRDFRNLRNLTSNTVQERFVCIQYLR